MEILQVAATELAKNSPYAFIIIALMWFYSKQNKTNLNQINSMFDKALDTMRKNQQETFSENRKTMRLLMGKVDYENDSCDNKTEGDREMNNKAKTRR